MITCIIHPPTISALLISIPAANVQPNITEWNLQIYKLQKGGWEGGENREGEAKDEEGWGERRKRRKMEEDENTSLNNISAIDFFPQRNWSAQWNLPIYTNWSRGWIKTIQKGRSMKRRKKQKRKKKSRTRRIHPSTISALLISVLTANVQPNTTWWNFQIQWSLYLKAPRYKGHFSYYWKSCCLTNVPLLEGHPLS